MQVLANVPTIFVQPTGPTAASANLPPAGTVTDAMLSTTSVVGELVANQQQSPAEIAASVLPVNYQFGESDIRRYGASTLLADNSAAINAALAVNNAGGHAVYIPTSSSVWRYTSTLLVLGACSLYGEGQSSMLQPVGCDGLTFQAQSTYRGSRFIRDFVLVGPSATTSSNNGIVCNLGTGTVNARITGVLFSNITVLNFQKAVYENGPYGMWNCTFTDCFLYNNYHGYYLNGQVTYFTVTKGLVQTGSMTGTGTRYGFYSVDNGGGNGQSIHLDRAFIYNYDVNIFTRNSVYTEITGCDLSVFTLCGIQVVGWQGAYEIRSNWIQALPGGTQNICGIYITDLGTQQFDKMTIDGNSLLGNSAAGTCGIYMGHFAGPISVTNNTIGNSVSTAGWAVGIGGTTPGALGVSAVGTVGAYNDGAVVTDNTIYCATPAGILVYSSVINMTVGPNVMQGSAVVAFSTPTTTPPGFRYFTNSMSGTATFAGSTTVTVAIPSMPNANYRVTHSGNAAGYCSVSAGRTYNSFTLACSASNSNSVDWSVQYS